MGGSRGRSRGGGSRGRAGSEPAGSGRAASEPAGSERAASEPVGSEPAGSEPAGSGPAASGPAGRSAGAGAGAGRLAALTPHQVALVELLAAGWDNARIAHHLRLSPRTVDNQLSRIYRRLGLAGVRGFNARVSLVLLYLDEDRAAGTGGGTS